MLYVTVERNEAGQVIKATVCGEDRDRQAAECRWSWKSLEEAKEVAEVLGEGYVACDAGAHVSPRYDVVQLPKIGDDVSYAFNGGIYPCGKIVSISKFLKVITTSEGQEFYRVCQTGNWLNNGARSLVKGHHYTQNPSLVYNPLVVAAEK